MKLNQAWFTVSFGAAAVCFLLSPVSLRAAGCGQIKPDATEAVLVAPGNHKVILENDTVRVLEATVPLHSREIPHTHFWPSVFFEQTSGLNEPWKTVKIRWSEGGPAKGFASSDRDRHNLLIELKGVDCQPAPVVDLPGEMMGPAQQVFRRFLQGLGQHTLESLVVARLLEQRQTRHATVEGVVDKASRSGARVTRHGRKATTARSPGQ